MNKIIVASNLSGFFYERLSEVNQGIQNPLSLELIVYSSEVLNKFLISENYFEYREGRVSEKLLGIKLLKSNQLDREAQLRELKDVADTALFLCGYFSSSIDKKIVRKSYYEQLGIGAYSKLNSYIPSCLDMPSFYKHLSQSFIKLTSLIEIVSVKIQNEADRVA